MFLLSSAFKVQRSDSECVWDIRVGFLEEKPYDTDWIKWGKNGDSMGYRS